MIEILIIIIVSNSLLNTRTTINIGVLEPHFFTSIFLIIWLLPKVVNFDQSSLENPAFTYIYSCLIASYLGFLSGRIHTRRSTFGYNPNSSRKDKPTKEIYYLAVFYSGLGLISFLASIYYAINIQGDAYQAWTGASTIWNFFTYLSTVAVSLFIGFELWKRRGATLYILIPYLCISSYRILILGRRAVLFELLIVACAYLWKKRGIIVSQKLALLVTPIFAIFINGIAAYRDYLKGLIPLDQVLPEMIFRIIALSESGAITEDLKNFVGFFTFYNQMALDHSIAPYWNSLVQSLVPAQIVGENFKTSLMLGGHFSQFVSYYDFRTGSTMTGFSDSYAAFGLYGIFVFYLYAFIIQRLTIGLKRNIPIYTAALICLSRVYVETFSHSTAELLITGVQFLIFSTPVILFSIKYSKPSI